MIYEEFLTLKPRDGDTPGEVVQIAYTGYAVRAEVIELEPKGTYGTLRGWAMVEQISDGYEDRLPGDRPRYEAAHEFISRLDEPLAPGPFTAGASKNMARGHRDRSKHLAKRYGG